MAFIVPGIYHSHERLGVPAKAADDESQRISPPAPARCIGIDCPIWLHSGHTEAIKHLARLCRSG